MNRPYAVGGSWHSKCPLNTLPTVGWQAGKGLAKAMNPKDGKFRKLARGNSGFSLIELLIVVAIILIIAAIAIPNLIRSKLAANEASAMESIHAILTASSLYYTTYNNGFPPTLAVLRPTVLATCNQAGLLDPLLANAPSQKSGYTVTYTQENGLVNPPTGCAAPGPLGFLVAATPISIGVTGARSFCTTEDGVIHFDDTGAAIATPAACDALPTMSQ